MTKSLFTIATIAIGSACATASPANATPPQSQSNPKVLRRVPVVCPGALGSEDEIARTPMANHEAELVALRLGTGVVADPKIYARVVRDLAAIRAREPALAKIQAVGWNDGKTLILVANDKKSTLMTRGAYHAWDCLNAHYGLESIGYMDNLGIVTVKLKGIFDTAQVACAYAKLPDVQSAEASQMTDSDDIRGWIDGTTYHYVFDHGEGDCMAGCITHVRQHRIVTADGKISDGKAEEDHSRSRFQCAP